MRRATGQGICRARGRKRVARPLIGVEIAKALILAGRPSPDRRWPSVASGPKQLVPVANRPILFHALESLRAAGLIEATIAVEPLYSRAIEAAVGDGSQWGLAVRYVRWRPGSGMPGALMAARGFLADEPALVGPADALYRERIHPHIASFASEQLDALTLRLPATPRADAAPVGGYLLSPRGIAAVAGRPHITADPVYALLDDGLRARVQEVDGCLPCHGDQQALLEGNRRMLEDLPRDVEPDRFPTCEFQGPVAIHPDAQLDHTLIRGPAIVGPGSRLSHAYVGPYTSVGANVTMEGTQIEHSIVLENAELGQVGTRLENSVIGRGARVVRTFGLPTAMTLSVGEGAEVTLS